MYRLVFNLCPEHGIGCVSLDNDKTGSGVRLTHGKCCGSWREAKAWPMDANDLREGARVFENAAEDAESPSPRRAEP